MYVLVLFSMLLFFAGSFLLEIKKRNNNFFTEVITIIIFFELILLMGFRYDVGIDYLTYESWFYDEHNGNKFEWIYNSLNYLVYISTGEFAVFTLLIAIITNYFIYKGLKAWNLNNYYLILAIFIYVSSIYFDFANMMRQGVAVSIFFYASNFIVKRDYKKYFFLVFLAMGFHFSSIILIPLYFIRRTSFNLLIYISLIIVCYYLAYTKFAQIIFNFFISISPYAGRYTGHEFIFQKEVNIFSLNVLGKVLLSVLLASLATKRINENKNNLMFYYQIGNLLYILSISTFMFGRVGIFFQIFELAAIPYLISNIKNSLIRTIIYLSVLLFMVVWIIYILFITPEVSNLIYKTVFDR